VEKKKGLLCGQRGGLVDSQYSKGNKIEINSRSKTNIYLLGKVGSRRHKTHRFRETEAKEGAGI